MAGNALWEECRAARSHLLQLRTELEQLNSQYVAKSDALLRDDEAARKLAADPDKQVEYEATVRKLDADMRVLVDISKHQDAVLFESRRVTSALHQKLENVTQPGSVAAAADAPVADAGEDFMQLQQTKLTGTMRRSATPSPPALKSC